MQETAVFQLLYVPCLVYQAIFKQRLVIRQRMTTSCFIPLRLTSRIPSSNVYPQSWAWAFLSVLQVTAFASWSLRRPHNPKLEKFSWNSLEARVSRSQKTTLRPTEDSTKLRALCVLTQFPTLAYVTSVAVGGHHTVALIQSYEKVKGDPCKATLASAKRLSNAPGVFRTRVYAWGWNDRGQLGNPSRIAGARRGDAQSIGETFEPLCFTDTDWRSTASYSGVPWSIDYSCAITDIVAGDDFTLALARDPYGLVFSWGDNALGQCGQGPEYLRIYSPRVIEILRGTCIRRIACSAQHCLALTNSGEVFAWGAYNYIGLETFPPHCNVYYPRHVPLYDPAGQPERGVEVHCGEGFNIIASEDPYCLKVWGRNDKGQLGLGQDHRKPEHHPRDLVISDLAKGPMVRFRVVRVSCGVDFAIACIAPSRGRIFLWGAFEVYDASETAAAIKESAPRTSPGTITGLFGRAIPLRPAASAPVVNIHGNRKQDKSTGSKIRLIRNPTVLSHYLWENKNIVQAEAGFRSSAMVCTDLR